MEQNETQVNEQKQPPYLIYAVVLVVILAAVVWLVLIPEQKEPQAPQVITPSEPVETIVKTEEQQPYIEPELETLVEPEPEPVQPVIVEPQPEPEPELLDDSSLMSRIVTMIPNKALTDLIIEQDLISNFVVFIDNASRGELVTQFSPMKEPQRKFEADQVAGDLLSYTINEQSFQRYNAYADVLLALPTEKSIELYRELAPAIDAAHIELGYEEGTFDRKLKRAIDFLVDAPVLTKDVTLVAPSAMYQYADAELEGLMAIQKLLLRMGPENQQKVRAKLLELRRGL